MKKVLLFLLALCFAVCPQGFVKAENIFINTPKTTLMLTANEGGTPRIHYYAAHPASIIMVRASHPLRVTKSSMP